MLKLSEEETERLKRIRRYLLWRYVHTDISDPRHSQYGRFADMIGYELNRRTGTRKYKV